MDGRNVSPCICQASEFSGGTLYAFTDWDKTQIVRGAKVGEGMIRELPIPDEIWGTARRDVVMDTYKDTFREHDFMARGWVTAIEEDGEAEPAFAEALHVQKVIAACQLSAKEGRRGNSLNPVFLVQAEPTPPKNMSLVSETQNLKCFWHR